MAYRLLVLLVASSFATHGKGHSGESAPMLQQEQQQRSALPSQGKEDELRRLVESKFDVKATLARKDVEATKALADRLLKEGSETKNLLEQRYVLFRMAIDVAETIGEAAVVGGGIQGLGREFGLDTSILRFNSAKNMARNGQNGCAAAALLELFVAAGRELIIANPARARSALREAEGQARRLSGDRVAYQAALESIRALKDAIHPADGGKLVSRTAVPPAAHPDRARARDTIKSKHGDFKAKATRQQNALVVQDLDEGTADSNPPGARYEYLQATIYFGARVGDPLIISQAVEEICQQFEVDVPQVRLGAAHDAVLGEYVDAEHLMRMFLDAARAAMGENHGLVQEALKHAEAQRDRHRSGARYKELCAEFLAAQQSCADAQREAALRAALKASPESMQPAEDLGWFLCAVREDWSGGLSLLAKGNMLHVSSGIPVSEIARKELVIPMTDDDAYEIAGAWWTAATSRDTPSAERLALRRHAGDWYRKLSHLEDLRRDMVHKRLDELKDVPTPVVVAQAAAAVANVKTRVPRVVATGTPQVDEAIEMALTWLARHQDDEGQWDCDGFMQHDLEGAPSSGSGDPLHDVGVTGLALLAFLSAESPSNSGAYRAQIQKGIDWLESQQSLEGQSVGLIGTDASHHFIYDHAIATVALCQAFGASSKDNALKNTAQRAINYLEVHRNPKGCWRYQRQARDNDVSVTGWAVQANTLAKQFGLEINEEGLRYAGSYIDEMTDKNGRTGYIEKGGLSSRHKGQHEHDFPAGDTEAMTAVGLLCNHLLGHGPKRHAIMQSQARVLIKRPPQWLSAPKGPTVDLYYWYHGARALRLGGGNAWLPWRAALRDALLANQQRAGNPRGSWDPVDVWGADGGRVYATALATMALLAAFQPR